MRTVFIWLMSVSVLQSCISKTKVDLIVHNATIYSIDENNTVYEAMAVNNGKIVALGKENQILNKYSSENKLDVKKQFVFPGFIDSHCHFLGYGLTLQQVDLTGCSSFEEVVKRCVDFNRKHNPEWLVGYGWDNSTWTNKSFPNRKLLDSLFPDKPVFLRRIDGHAAIANKTALDIAEITDSTRVNGGHIEMIDNVPTGILIDNAMNLVLSKIPSPSLDEKKKALLDAQRNCLAVGLTSIVEAGLNREDIELIERLHRTEELKIRVYAMINDNEENFDYYLNTIGEPYKTERLNVRAFKFFGDGAMGSRGACLLEPYADVTDSLHYGFLLKDTSYFKKYAKILYEKGFQMCTHAIGDSTVRTFLNIYGEVLQTKNDRRWRIEHAQQVAPEDFDLFGRYSIIPSVQPTHATSDYLWVESRLGKERMPFGYAYKRLLKQNGWIPLGTDFPIENIDPLLTFYAATVRKDKDGMPPGGFQMENALSREDAIRGMTIWGALANFEEQEKGSLEIGKWADFVVLNQDILSIKDEELLNTNVIYTYISGEKTF